MKPRQRAAIELLLSHPDTDVAEMLGVRLQTLRNWMRADSFASALKDRELDLQRGARRIARQAAVNSAARLCQLVTDPDRAEFKMVLDVVKASGLFDADTEDPGPTLADMIRIARQRAEANGAESG